MPGAAWSYLRQLASYTWALEGEDPLLGEVAAELYSGATLAQGTPQAVFALERQGEDWVLRRGGTILGRARTLAGFFQVAEWALTHETLLRLSHFFQVHAGTVVREGRARLIVGPPESGKTSLSLALALHGWSLFGDEVALLEPASLQVRAYRRDLILRPGTRALLMPDLPPVPEFKWVAGDCYFPPRLLGVPPAPDPADLSGLIFPVLRLGARVEWAPLGLAEAARRLLEQSLNLGDWGAAGVELVGRLVETCPAVELVFGDAREAAEVFSEIPGMAKAPGRKG